MPPVIEKPSDTTYGPLWRFMWRIFPGSYVIEQMFYRCLNELFYFAFDDNPLGRAVTKVCFNVSQYDSYYMNCVFYPYGIRFRVIPYISKLLL